ncbi:MAG: GDP-mannose 4,6-dehydratase [Anaerolineae bacterium]|nr:GDP-mannose 4,6-dehydratase [Anaerolineae bacterium]
MKALITGITGFVGSHLAEYLLEVPAWEVAGTFYHQPDHIEHLRSRVCLFRADLSRPEEAQAVLEEYRPDCIFHLAAQSLTARSHQDPWQTLETNIRMQLNVLEGVRRLNLPARLLVVGSGEEYGLVQPEELPIREEQPFRPLNPYAVSKITQDMLGLQYHLSYGLDVVRVRPFNHIGPRQRLGFVAPDFAHQIAEAEAGRREPVIRVGNLDVSRDFSDVRDVVRAYYLAVVKGEAGEVYNIGSGQARSIRELLEGLLRLSTIPLRCEESPAQARPVDIPCIRADFSKFHARTGWKPEIPFEQSLKDILDYWRAEVRKSLERQ